jgi:small subunit ribosomal protein S20
MMRTQMKKALAAISSGDKEAAQTQFVAVSSVLDSMAGKGLIHKNKAARHKSRLAAKVKAL